MKNVQRTCYYLFENNTKKKQRNIYIIIYYTVCYITRLKKPPRSIIGRIKYCNDLAYLNVIINTRGIYYDGDIMFFNNTAKILKKSARP
jgi:hypothetical protein